MAQQCMSSESTPVLSGAVPAFEVFMAQWKSLSEAIPHCAPFTKVGLEWAETYYKRMGRTRAYAVAMCKLISPESRLPSSVAANFCIRSKLLTHPSGFRG
jgi:hypothetical protein